jgi:hypothetical protein
MALAALVIASAGPTAARASVGHLELLGGAGAGPLPYVADKTERFGPTRHRTPELTALVDPAVVAVIELPTAGVVEASAEAHAANPGQRLRSGPFSMNLISQGDFVNQKTTYWCIPASTQTMMNIMEDGRPDRSRSLQARLYRVGDRLDEDGTFSNEPEPDSFRGMGISEWVGLLNRYGYGPYELAGAKSRQNALRLAARMMRTTGKPVGLVVWRGAHAWVMSGFVATADPAATNDFTVTSVWVHDPWYPRVSSIWGPSRPPHTRVSPRILGTDFKPYGRSGRRDPERDGRFMLVLPRPAAGTPAA